MPDITKTLLVLAGLATLLSSCNDDQPRAATREQKQETSVNVVKLEPTAVPITSELAGRIVATNTADVRPQVSGIIKAMDFTEGGDVKQGDLLYQIDPASYEAAYQSALATLARAQASENNARAKTDRLSRLNQTKAASSQDYEDAVLALDQAKADVASAKAGIETARINLERTKITAPISGRIDRSTINVGALVTAEQATALTTIRKLDPVYVEVTQPSEKLLAFRRATRDGSLTPVKEPAVHLTLEDGSAYPETGKLLFSEAVISETSGTIVVRALFQNPDKLLLPGMYVRAAIEEGVADASYLVPQRAVTRTVAGDAMTKVVMADGKVGERKLKVDRSQGSNWVVRAGLEAGDRVIVEGAQKVRAGDAVKATEVTINADGRVLAASAEPDDASTTVAER
ncbi:efflux RND transporter periplasmic adaptor subunit [Rhizobium sp.]